MSLPASFDLTPEDAKLLLAANVHLGAKNVQVCSTIAFKYLGEGKGKFSIKEKRKGKNI